MNLGQLLLQAVKGNIKTGNIQGICVVCSKETDEGLPLKECVSDNFTGWSYFFAGNCMCPECAFLFSDQTFRKKSWVASTKEFCMFKNDEAQQILFNPPEPPFFIHIAKIGQKQTWLLCIHKIAHNQNKYFFSHEKYDVPILFDRAKAQEHVDNIAMAIEKGVTKTELRTCEFNLKTWQNALREGYRDFLNKISKCKGDILWEVMVDVYRAAD